ncbi:helix-turn-helix domain-containing protein [Streptomyces sp. NPDC093149]|uniref:helix-turn-helix domain-containing protein n=1 Tax=Streptomyces sp. NPDC093149 TaxID=3366031 RepID=UPI00381FDEE3
MSEREGAGGTGEFAALLRELKDRSGLSYGALAKRLHMSTSTLHRYCNGTALPTEYAPAERFARVCRATPPELVELHRQWILADAARKARPDQGTAAGARNAGDTAADPTPATDSAEEAGPAEETGSAETAGGTGSPEMAVTGQPTASADAASTHGPGGDDEPVVVDMPRGPVPLRRRRNALIASVAVAAVLGAVVLAVNVPFGRGGNDAGDRRAADTTVATTDTAHAKKPPATDAATPSPTGRSRTPSPSTSTAGPTPGSSKRGDAPGAAERPGGSTAVPLNVASRPYVYDSPCSQHFLVDSEPEQVGPPASEQDAPRWAAAYGAVSSGEQRVALTVQGTGRDTVVLEALHVRVVGKGAPLAWNDYSMGVGCGGGVGTKSFDIDLDNGSPMVTVKNGQRDFPYKVSESDPEVFYITAHTKAHDVRWDLSLDWSSGGRRGTVHIDSGGTPFRTSADAGRPGYDYPLGGGEWIEREEG